MYFQSGQNIQFEDSERILTQDKIILVTLIVEHIFSYCASIFRNWDIERNGKMDVNGIVRAPTESMLANIEVFFDSIIFGYTVNHMV